jgi:hypothetical protein
MRTLTHAAMLVALISGFRPAPGSAGSALYFEKLVAKTSSERTCFNFARSVARDAGFRSAHQNPLEVAGQVGGAYVSITCVGRGQEAAVAVVMSVADSFDVARQAGHDVAERMRRIGCIDLPC